jgi:hypothetical protein
VPRSSKSGTNTHPEATIDTVETPQTAARSADGIFAAATDGSDQLRYLVGNDTSGLPPFLLPQALAA